MDKKGLASESRVPAFFMAKKGLKKISIAFQYRDVKPATGCQACYKLFSSILDRTPGILNILSRPSHGIASLHKDNQGQCQHDGR
jgi:hypothetical protein